METKQYINPDEKLFSDKEWARDEYGFKVKQGESIQNKKEYIVDKRYIRIKLSHGLVSIINPQASNQKEISLKKGNYLMGINWSRIIESATGGVEGSGYLVIGIIKKEDYQNDVDLTKAVYLKMPTRILNKKCYDSRTRMINVEKDQDFVLFLACPQKEGQIKMKEGEVDLRIISL